MDKSKRIKLEYEEFHFKNTLADVQQKIIIIIQFIQVYYKEKTTTTKKCNFGDAHLMLLHHTVYTHLPMTWRVCNAVLVEVFPSSTEVLWMKILRNKNSSFPFSYF